ncbi:hypothetical protein LL033_10005 [Clostridium estertheticum]|uniref:hypothetical protein n=1 Tax=Clostridium estertheticum TaxID=238834 RepID=UPI001C0ACAA5|nr:hypothetical protein [Clostridium estertheticum]MBU3217802.1 hypothetical protein [Clostridium estertheticum]WAG57489.1 hypothetical protein LL033_10005 [Clostridium estertheticum]
MIRIMERDKNFLIALNETGASNTHTLFRFYPENYGRERIGKMEAEKLVTRKYGLIMLGVEGKNYLESIGIIPKILDRKSLIIQRRLARALEFKYLLPVMEVVTSSRHKKEHNLNRGMQFIVAATIKTGLTYLIYDVPKRITIGAQTQLLKELKNKTQSIDRAIIFTKNTDFVQIVSEGKIHIDELLLLPPIDLFVKLTNEMAEGDFDRRVIGAAFPDLIEDKVFSKKRNQYLIDGNAYINMVLNNINVFSTLSSLNIQDKINDNFVQTYNIVCLDIQEQYFF